jgi:hypothetical protein
MKKSLMILASVALGASMAVGQDVESKNIVGFVAKTGVTSGKFWLVGLNFQNMTNGNFVEIQDLFPTNELYADPSGLLPSSDKIQTWNGTAYTTYNYLKKTGNPPKWYKNFGSQDAVGTKLSRSAGLWYYRATDSTATTLTVMGQAPMDPNCTHGPLPAGAFYIIANGYPHAVAVTNLGINSYADPSGVSANSDKIQTWNGTAYTTYNYLKKTGFPAQWYKNFGSQAFPEFALNPGESAWYYRATAGGTIASFTENKPY